MKTKRKITIGLNVKNKQHLRKRQQTIMYLHKLILRSCKNGV